MRLRPSALSLRARSRIAFVVVLLTMIAMTFTAQRLTRDRNEARQGFFAVQAAGSDVFELLEILVDQETSVRGYVITGEVTFLAPYDGGGAREGAVETRLRRSFADRPAMLAHLTAVIDAARAWHVRVAEPEITAVRQERPAAATAIARSAGAIGTFDQVRAAVAVLKSDVSVLEVEALAAFQNARARLDAALLLILAGGLLNLLLTGVFLRRWLLRPLARITQAVREVSAGATATTVPATGPPELAGLGADIDLMRRRVLTEAASARAANVALRQGEARLRLVLDNLGDYGVLGLDSTGAIISSNAEAGRRSGISGTALVGAGLSSRDPGWAEIVGITAPQLAQAARCGQVESTHARPTPPDDALRWYRTVITAIRDDTGDLLGFADISQDITAAKDAQDALTLSHDQLVAANGELEAFSYSVAHDLRAPLRAISGFSRILVDEYGPTLDAEARRYLTVVDANALRMGVLIDDLLSFAQLLRSPLTKARTPLGDVVRTAWEELAAERADRTVELHVADLPALPCDRALLQRVFVNLLGNALKFTATREVARIDVGVVPSPNSGGQPSIVVRDNGIGFDPVYAERIFGVFKRLHPTDEYEGTGVGLAIVHRVITRHGGRVCADGTPDQGATFTFTLGPDPALTTIPRPTRSPDLDGAAMLTLPAESDPAVGGAR